MMKVMGLKFCEWHPEVHHFTNSGQCWVWFCWSWQNSYVQSICQVLLAVAGIYILFKAAGALAVCFLGCFKYCLSWIAFKGNALCVNCKFPSFFSFLCVSLDFTADHLMQFFARKFGSFFAFVQRWQTCTVFTLMALPSYFLTFSCPPLVPHSKVRELGNRCITLSKDAPRSAIPQIWTWDMEYACWQTSDLQGQAPSL